MAKMRISNSSWKKPLSEKLKRLALKPDARIAVVGIGAELNGDDAIGLVTARKLKQAVGQREKLLVLDGGTLPENTSGALRRFHPDLVLFIDAAALGETPGTIAVIDPECIGGASFSTHSMPLKLMMEYLAGELRCDMLLIGVQPESAEFGLPLSESGKKAAARLARELALLIV